MGGRAEQAGGCWSLSLLTFTRRLQEELAASCVSALYQRAGWIWKITDPPPRRRGSSSTMLLHRRGRRVQTGMFFLPHADSLGALVEMSLNGFWFLFVQDVPNASHDGTSHSAVRTQATQKLVSSFSSRLWWPTNEGSDTSVPMCCKHGPLQVLASPFSDSGHVHVKFSRRPFSWPVCHRFKDPIGSRSSRLRLLTHGAF